MTNKFLDFVRACLGNGTLNEIVRSIELPKDIEIEDWIKIGLTQENFDADTELMAFEMTGINEGILFKAPHVNTWDITIDFLLEIIPNFIGIDGAFTAYLADFDLTAGISLISDPDGTPRLQLFDFSTTFGDSYFVLSGNILFDILSAIIWVFQPFIEIGLNAVGVPLINMILDFGITPALNGGLIEIPINDGNDVVLDARLSRTPAWSAVASTIFMDGGMWSAK